MNIFTAMKYGCILHGLVCVMRWQASMPYFLLCFWPEIEYDLLRLLKHNVWSLSHGRIISLFINLKLSNDFSFDRYQCKTADNFQQCGSELVHCYAGTLKTKSICSFYAVLGSDCFSSWSLHTFNFCSCGVQKQKGKPILEN